MELQSPEIGASPSRPWSGRFADVCVVLLFLVLSVVHVTGRWGGTIPFDLLTGDASLYASVAAARDSPQLFQGDELLGDPRNTRLFTTVLIPLCRALARLTGDYGTAFIALLGPHALLQMIGFYVLGRVLLGSRFWALLLALVTVPRVFLNIGEYWGFHSDAQPRFLFQGLWPLALAAALRWSDRPRAWPWLLAAVGPLAFVHPVSTPALALSLWLGFWAVLPPSWLVSQRVRHMLLVGVVFAISLAPYLVAYLGGYERGRTTPEVDAVLSSMAGTTAHIFEVGPVIVGFAAALRPDWPYVVAAAIAGVLLWRWLPDRRRLQMVILWTAGILVTSIVLPAALRMYARQTGTFTLDTQLPRNLRYLVPLMLILILWALAELDRRCANRGWGWRTAPVTAGLAVTLGFWLQHEPRDIVKGGRCWAYGHLLCPLGKQAGIAEAMGAIRRVVPERALIAAASLEGRSAIQPSGRSSTPRRTTSSSFTRTTRPSLRGVTSTPRCGASWPGLGEDGSRDSWSSPAATGPHTSWPTSRSTSPSWKDCLREWSGPTTSSHCSASIRHPRRQPCPHIDAMRGEAPAREGHSRLPRAKRLVHEPRSVAGQTRLLPDLVRYALRRLEDRVRVVTLKKLGAAKGQDIGDPPGQPGRGWLERFNADRPCRLIRPVCSVCDYRLRFGVKYQLTWSCSRYTSMRS